MISMKKQRLLSLVLTLSLVLGIFAGKTGSSAADTIAIQQTGATNDSITFTWEYEKPVDIYVDLKLVQTKVRDKYTLKMPGMTAGKLYSVTLVESGKPVNEGSAYSVRTKPARMSVNGITYSPESNVLSVKWKEDHLTSDGYKIEVESIDGTDGGVGYVENANNENFDLKLKTNRFYRVRICAYLQFRTKHLFGTWSEYRYVATMPDASFEKGEGKSVNVSWKKVKNVSKYEISVGRNADGSDAVKSATLGKKKTSAVIKTMGTAALEADGKPYYFFLRPYVKVKKKDKASSVAAASGPIYFYVTG